MLHFDAAQFVDGGAIDAGTTQLLITGQTTAGDGVQGIDDVRIVGGGG